MTKTGPAPADGEEGVVTNGTRKSDTIQGTDFVDTVNGGIGDDVLITEDGNDLVAGDLLGDEWSFVDGVWVYDPSRINWDGVIERSYDDVIIAGGGNDVVLGNGGNDRLSGNAGHDVINGGTGNDQVYGGRGKDILNLEDGDDYAEGGEGADTINAGKGDDVVYGDGSRKNLLAASIDDAVATSFSQFGASGNWDILIADGKSSMSQSLSTEKGVSYQISFDLAANIEKGSSAAAVEVLWNGTVVGSFETSSGLYTAHSVDVVGSGASGVITFREIETGTPDGPEILTDGPVLYYEKSVEINGRAVDVSAFAPGQALLYQVISGHLKAFDTATNTYSDIGDAAGFSINAIGYNQEDDLIYGHAKGVGVDHLGKAVAVGDLVMFDAKGNAYTLGTTGAAYFVGDFDDSGNLWAFDHRLNAISKIDVDNFDAFGNPVVTRYFVPHDLFSGPIYDITYSSDENAFYAIVTPKKNGGTGQIMRIDLSDLDKGGNPTFESLEINRTLFGADFKDGMPRGAFGAVFMDGDGNLYFGLNSGDHDLDGTTGAKGAIYQVHADWDGGAAYVQFMAEAERTGNNDGAVDPRSGDPFEIRETDAPFFLREPTLVSREGEDDVLRGGIGDDLIYGGAGDDRLNGGMGADRLYGDEGDDRIQGAKGDDVIYGGDGNDKIIDGDGNDRFYGGDGKDYIHGGDGDDQIVGGAGVDKLVGGAGSDTINGGAGNDNLWGGNFTDDGVTDVFVFNGQSGKDYIHDFDVGTDKIDLSVFRINYTKLLDYAEDKGWAAVIDLYAFDGGVGGDRIVLPDVTLADLSESNFIF